MPCAMDIIFEGPRLGWKERWYSIVTAPRDAAVGMQTLLAARDNLTGVLVNITGVVATDLRTVNNTYYISNPYQVAPVDPGAGTITDVPSDAVMCRVSAQLNGFFYHRVMWLRGVFDGWIQFDINNNPIYSPNMLTRVNTWQKQISPILANGLPNPNVVFPLYLRVIAKDQGINPKVKVTAVSIGAGTPQMIVVSAGNTGFVVGQNVKVAGNRGQNLKQLPPGRAGVNGNWNVVAVTSSLVTIGLPYSYLPGIPNLRVQGYVRSNTIAYAPIFAVTVLRFGSRITGKIRQPARGAKRKRLPSI